MGASRMGSLTGAHSRSFVNRPGWREFQTVLAGLRGECPPALPVVVRAFWLPETILGQCLRRDKRFVVQLNRDLGEPQAVEVRTSPAISGARITTKSAELLASNRAAFRDTPSPRPATASQVKAIRAIAARRKIDIVGLLRERFGLITADELGIRQASNLIDELKSEEPTASPSTNGHANGNGAYAAGGAK